MKTVIDKQEIPVLAETDVVVVGGGPAGIGAALSSARNGAKTVLIERFGCLGGMQTQCTNSKVSLVDPEIQGGILQEIIERMKKGGGVYRDASNTTRTGEWMGSVFFHSEYYKYLLDLLMQEASVKVFFHAFATGALKEGKTIKGIFIESKEAKHAVLGKVIIDCTGDADIIWKSGEVCDSGGFPDGPKKGRHMGFGYAFYVRGVDQDKFEAFRKANPEDWGPNFSGKKLVAKAKAESKLYGNRAGILFSEYLSGGLVRVMSPQFPLPMGHHGWTLEDQSVGEADMRKQTWSMWELLRNNVPGWENSYVDKTPNALLLRDTHRMIGEYVLTKEAMRSGRAFDDSIAISNMAPDIFGPDDEHTFVNNAIPYDIPYRSLVSKQTDNLLSAGSTISADFYTWAAVRYCSPSICTGEAAGAAAALSIKNKVKPGKLNVKKLQDTLRKQEARLTVKEVPEKVLAEYREKARKATPMSLGPEKT